MRTGQRAHRCVACEPWPRRGCLGTSPPSSIERCNQGRNNSHPAHRDNWQPVELATIDKGGRARYSGKGTSPGAVVFTEDGGSCPSQPRAAAAAPCGCRPFPHNRLLAKFPERAMRCLCIGIKGLFECPSINIMLRLCIIRVASRIDFVSTRAEQRRRVQLRDCTQHSHRKIDRSR